MIKLKSNIYSIIILLFFFLLSCKKTEKKSILLKKDISKKDVVINKGQNKKLDSIFIDFNDNKKLDVCFLNKKFGSYFFESIFDKGTYKYTIECPEILGYENINIFSSNKKNIKLHYYSSTFVSTIDLILNYDRYKKKWIIVEGVFTNPIRMDYDSKIEICRSILNIDMHNSINKSEEISDKLSDNKKDCLYKFEISKSFSAIYAFYKNNIDEISEMGVGIKRLEAYINKYPINFNTLAKYNDIAYYLEQSKLYNESIYLLKKIIKKSPKRTVAYINLGDAYWNSQNKEKAKDAYKIYLEQMKEKSKEQKIPKRIFERLK